MLEETLMKVKSDKDFFEKQKSLKKFCKKFKSFLGKTIDEFPDEELKKHTEIIKEFLGRHDKVRNFFQATDNIKSDTVPLNYI